ncbi:MAG TPA: DUF4431 domain-containing protein [Pyrinomonadaceae bacterium]|jgi:hypothetical protein|nr:DUF4431 domain-containing protein [Pyrinomonadaceae bacterium]
MKVTLCIISLAFAAAVSIHGQRQQFHYEPEKVTLTGRVVLRTFFGPPDYGENPKTDTKEHNYILILDSLVDVIGTNSENETERKVRQVTLVISDPNANQIRPFLSKRVKVEGTLFHAITGHHHTRVLMTVSSIRRARRGERL